MPQTDVRQAARYLPGEPAAKLKAPTETTPKGEGHAKYHPFTPGLPRQARKDLSGLPRARCGGELAPAMDTDKDGKISQTEFAAGCGAGWIQKPDASTVNDMKGTKQ